MSKPLPNAPYYVYLCRSESRPLTEVWPVHLDQRLPEVPVPLLSGDPDVMLDLQDVLTNVYDLCAYDLELDYTQPPHVTLSPEEAAWVEEHLRSAGLPSLKKSTWRCGMPPWETWNRVGNHP